MKKTAVETLTFWGKIPMKKISNKHVISNGMSYGSSYLSQENPSPSDISIKIVHRKLTREQILPNVMLVDYLATKCAACDIQKLNRFSSGVIIVIS